MRYPKSFQEAVFVFNWESYPEYEMPEDGWERDDLRDGMDAFLDYMLKPTWVSEPVSPEECGGARKIFAIKVDVEALGEHELFWAEHEIIRIAKEFGITGL